MNRIVDNTKIENKQNRIKKYQDEKHILSSSTIIAYFLKSYSIFTTPHCFITNTIY